MSQTIFYLQMFFCHTPTVKNWFTATKLGGAFWSKKRIIRAKTKFCGKTLQWQLMPEKGFMSSCVTTRGDSK